MQAELSLVEDVVNTTCESSWDRFLPDLLATTGVEMSERHLHSEKLGEMIVPLTTAFVHAKPAEYWSSPRPFSLGRKLENAFLFRLSKTGIFSTGRWLDFGGARAYGDWLKIPQSRYDVFNLPGVPGTTIVGDFEDASTMDFSRQYDGVISFNSLLLARKPESAINNIMRLLKPNGQLVLDFSVEHRWYIGTDGEHWSTFNPLQVACLLCPYVDNFVIVPIGNLFEACADYYARRRQIRFAASIIHWMGMLMGRIDRDPRTAMHYVAIGQKKPA